MVPACGSRCSTGNFATESQSVDPYASWLLFNVPAYLVLVCGSLCSWVTLSQSVGQAKRAGQRRGSLLATLLDLIVGSSELKSDGCQYGLTNSEDIRVKKQFQAASSCTCRRQTSSTIFERWNADKTRHSLIGDSLQAVAGSLLGLC